MSNAPDGKSAEVPWHSAVRGNWPWLLTGVTLILGVVLVLASTSDDHLSALGSMIAGVGSMVAFIWLIAAYLQQGEELRLQRRELSLQRQAIELQKEELARLGKFTGLDQVARIFETFEALLEREEGPARSISKLSSAYLNSMKLWKTILESPNADTVLAAYTSWLSVETPCRNFLAQYMSAVDLYCEAADIELVRPDLSSIERVYHFNDRFGGFPHIAAYASAAYGIATQMSLGEPGLDKLRLRGVEATQKIAPGTVNLDALEALRAKIKARDDAIAARRAESGAQPGDGGEAGA